MRSTTLRALVLAGLLAAAVAVTGQDVSSSGGVDVESFSSSGGADGFEGFSSSAADAAAAGGVVSSSAPVTVVDSSVVASSTASGGASSDNTVESSSAAGDATSINSVQSSSAAAAAAAAAAAGVASSTAAAVGGAFSTAAAAASSDNTLAQSSSAASRAPLTGHQALNPSVAPDGTTQTSNGQCYFPTDGSNVVPAGATYLTSAHFTIVGPTPDTQFGGNLAVLTPANGGGIMTGISVSAVPCGTADCTVDVTGPIIDFNTYDVLQVTGGQIIGLCLVYPVASQSFGYDASATGTFSAIDYNKVWDSNNNNFIPFTSSDYFTPAFNGALLFTVEYGYPTPSSTGAGDSSNSDVVASSTAVNGGSNNNGAGGNVVASSTGGTSSANNGNNPRAAVSSSTGSQGGANNGNNGGPGSSSSAGVRRTGSSSGDVRRMGSSSSSTGPRVIDTSTLPAWIHNISSSGIGGGDCIPGLTCAAPHAASSSVGMILAAAIVALAAAFAQ